MIGFKELLVIAVIIALLFGTSKLRNIGTDIGTPSKTSKNLPVKVRSRQKQIPQKLTKLKLKKILISREYRQRVLILALVNWFYRCHCTAAVWPDKLPVVARTMGCVGRIRYHLQVAKMILTAKWASMRFGDSCIMNKL